jgi:sirohydrochlorin cobaltochelatase
MNDVHLVLVAHGSRDPLWRKPLEDLAKRLAADCPASVHLAYLERCGPHLGEILDRAVEAGGAKLLVLPLFLSSHGHVRRDIEPVLDALRDRTGVQAELLPALGEMPQLASMLAQVLRQRLDGS